MPRVCRSLWLNANRAKIKEENPEAPVTQVAKIGGEKWKALNAAARAPWDEMAKKDKARYEREMAEYKAAAKAKAQEGDDDDDDDADRIDECTQDADLGILGAGR